MALKAIHLTLSKTIWLNWKVCENHFPSAVKVTRISTFFMTLPLSWSGSGTFPLMRAFASPPPAAIFYYINFQKTIFASIARPPTPNGQVFILDASYAMTVLPNIDCWDHAPSSFGTWPWIPGRMCRSWRCSRVVTPVCSALFKSMDWQVTKGPEDTEAGLLMLTEWVWRSEWMIRFAVGSPFDLPIHSPQCQRTLEVASPYSRTRLNRQRWTIFMTEILDTFHFRVLPSRICTRSTLCVLYISQVVFCAIYIAGFILQRGTVKKVNPKNWNVLPQPTKVLNEQRDVVLLSLSQMTWALFSVYPPCSSTVLLDYVLEEVVTRKRILGSGYLISS